MRFKTKKAVGANYCLVFYLFLLLLSIYLMIYISKVATNKGKIIFSRI